MIEAPVRLLFVPVSGPRGTGEYARSLVIAMAAAARWPQAEIRFVISREAPYAADVPFPTTLLPSSATFHPREVAALIEEVRPHIVIFDNAGRTTQLRAARRAGAHIVFISSRSTPRRRAFRPRWMHYLDEHWIAYPQFLAGSPRWSERLKLRLFGRPRLRFLNPLLPQANVVTVEETLAQYGVQNRDYILIAPGGGTERVHTRQALLAIGEAAQRLASRGHHVVLVGLQPSGTHSLRPEQLHLAPRLPGPMLTALLHNAALALVSGGYTLVQTLTCDCPAVAVPLAGDQSERIDACVRAGLAIRGEPDAAALESTLLGVLANPAQREIMRAARSSLGMTNGVPEVIEALSALLTHPVPHGDR